MGRAHAHHRLHDRVRRRPACSAELRVSLAKGVGIAAGTVGGVAVQSFVTRFREVAAERVAGIVLLSTLAYTPFGSRSTRTKAFLEKVSKRAPDAQWLWDAPNVGFLAARVGFGKSPRPSHVELVREMMAECPPETRRDAPATREMDLLDPSRTVARVDAIVLAAGSAFGLAAAAGVMRYLAERGQGYATAAGPVAIVPAACIFDLLEASGRPPDASDGYEAAVAAAR